MSEMVDRVAKAIHDEMDIADSLALPEATRYAIAAIEVVRQIFEELAESTIWDQHEMKMAASVMEEALIDKEPKPERTVTW